MSFGGAIVGVGAAIVDGGAVIVSRLRGGACKGDCRAEGESKGRESDEFRFHVHPPGLAYRTSAVEAWIHFVGLGLYGGVVDYEALRAKCRSLDSLGMTMFGDG